MLTSHDLNQIRLVVEEVFDRKFDEKFDKKFDEKFDEKFEKSFEKAFAKAFGEIWEQNIEPVMATKDDIRELREELLQVELRMSKKLYDIHDVLDRKLTNAIDAGSRRDEMLMRRDEKIADLLEGEAVFTHTHVLEVKNIHVFPASHG